jgi:hypothetical protein
MTPEHRVAQALINAATKRGLFIRKLRWEGRVGAPDYIILAGGRAFFVEAKAPGETPRASQCAEFARIGEAGCPVMVVDSEFAAREAVRWICEEYF